MWTPGHTDEVRCRGTFGSGRETEDVQVSYRGCPPVVVDRTLTREGFDGPMSVDSGLRLGSHRGFS